VNQTGVFAGVLALVLGVALIVQIRAGAISVKYFRGMRGRIRREDSPGLFWLLAALYAGGIVVLASFAFSN
jgi:hypothetical protein